MDPQFEELARAIAEIVVKGVDERLEQIKTGLDERLQQFKTDVESGLQVHFEDTKSVVVFAAEGYGGTLDAINRRLSRLETKVDRNYRLQAAVLKDHGERIDALEKR